MALSLRIKDCSVNAADQVQSLSCAHALASSVTLVRQHFPEAYANLTPWRADPETRRWLQPETLDLAFHFPGWSPRLECRSLLMQLTIRDSDMAERPHLLGVLMRGMTFEGERWRLVTVGDWQPTGSHLPQMAQLARLHTICRDLFDLFPLCSTSDDIE